MPSKTVPPVIEASRSVSAGKNGASITRLKDPRAHTKQAVSAAIVMAFVGMVMVVTSIVGSWESLDDCRMRQIERGTPEHSALHADDKHSQFVFVIIFHVAYLGLSCASIITLAGDSKTLRHAFSVVLFWIVDATSAYMWRLIIYIFAVKPLGLAIEGTNCGTSKLISGHTHFYCFHILQLAFVLFIDSRPFLASTSKKGALVSGDSADPRFLAWLVQTTIKAYALLVILWTFGTLQQTYLLGFHSLRHMISGFSAACLSFSVFVSFFAVAPYHRVLMSLLLRLRCDYLLFP